DHADVDVLAEHGVERVREIERVQADLTLVDDGLLRLEHIFDRILDSQDMFSSCLVDDLDQAGQRRGLALADRTDDQKEALWLPGKRLEDRRQIELRERADGLGYKTQRDGKSPLAIECVAAEPR